MYKIDFSKKVENQLKKLEENTQARILLALEKIKFSPFSFVKRKQGTPHFILRVGYYRVIVEINSDYQIINVLELGLRGNIYKR